MTEPSNLPDEAQLHTMADAVRLAANSRPNPDTQLLCEYAEAFLRDPRLLEALRVWEAVKYVEANNMEVRRLPQVRLAPQENWLVGNEDMHSPYCTTLPEAVSHLRSRLSLEAEGGKT